MEELTTMEQEEQETTTQETETQETETQETETQEQEQETQEQETEQQEESLVSEIEPLPENTENIIHELFAELGVNLDYTPVNNFQCFTMSLQFLAALWFIWWFVKYLFSIMRSFLSPKAW